MPLDLAFDRPVAKTLPQGHFDGIGHALQSVRIAGLKLVPQRRSLTKCKGRVPR